jgi:2-oxoglutarate dehydrogenase E2 component (dihydrolipoamide succinyltransferase)
MLCQWVRLSQELNRRTLLAIAAAAPAAPAQTPVYQHVAPPVVAAAPAFVPSGEPRFYSPLVMNIASKEGIGMAELEMIPGTGNEGRVTKNDILKYVSDKKAGIVPQAAPQPVVAAAPVAAAPVAAAPVAAAPVATPPAPQPVSVAPQPVAPSVKAAPAPVISGNTEIIEMDRMRKLIAEHMVRSKATSPHVTSFTEADVTNIVTWRDREKGPFEKKFGEKITFTPLFIEAIALCIRKFPLINCSLEGDKIILKKDINIGMATALPTGNLIVPVIRNADTKNLYGLCKEVNALAGAARTNKLRPDDTQGGTFTLTNVGTFGSLMGTPIINQPQVAILAVGAIKKRPMVMETPEGDVIAIRHMMYLSLSYDHRIVDGALGATFLTAVANELEAFAPDRRY